VLPPLLFACLLLLPSIVAAWSGKVVEITDGDTIVVVKGDKKLDVRLYGVDAPESDQPYGLKAKQFTKRVVGNRSVHVDTKYCDRYGRLVALVYPKSNIVSLNEKLLKIGLAQVYDPFCQINKCNRWHLVESRAQQSQKGFWSNSIKDLAEENKHKAHKTNGFLLNKDEFVNKVFIILLGAIFGSYITAFFSNRKERNLLIEKWMNQVRYEVSTFLGRCERLRIERKLSGSTLSFDTYSNVISSRHIIEMLLDKQNQYQEDLIESIKLLVEYADKSYLDFFDLERKIVDKTTEILDERWQKINKEMKYTFFVYTIGKFVKDIKRRWKKRKLEEE
jgi:endonuclease YncB( thermonuclease family)